MRILRHNRAAAILALLATLLLSTGAAWAWWAAKGSGHGSGQVGALGTPSGVGASSPVGYPTVNVSWTAAAPVNGLTPTGYYAERWNGTTGTVDGGSCGTPTAPVNVTSCTDTPVSDGSYTYTVVAVYRSWTSSSGHSTSVTVANDTTPPTTTLSTSPTSPEGSNGWFKQTSVSFTLAATDSGSGVAETFYQVDGGEKQRYSSAVAIASQGEHTVSYWSIDHRANEETHHQAHIKLDTIAPQTTIALQPAAANGSNGWYVTAPTFTVSASDNASGVASTSYQIDGGTTHAYTGSAIALTAGLHTVSYFSTDTAGNVEGTNTTSTIKIDTTAPTDAVSLGASPSHAYLSGTTLYFGSAFAGSFTLTDTVSDSGSGPASTSFPLLAATHWTHAAQTVSTPAGGPFASSTYSWSAGAAAPAQAERTVTSADAAGNTGSGALLSFVADATAPAGGVLSVNGTSATPGGSTSTSTSTGFSIGARSDYTETQGSGQSGLASSTLTIQSETLSKNTCGTPGSGGAYTAPSTISGTSNPAIADGYCYLYTLTGTDNVGNAASIYTTVKVDATAPANSLALGSSPVHADLVGTTLYFDGAAPGSFTLVNTVADAATGPASATFPAVTSSNWTHAAQTVSSPAEGPYSSSAYSWSAGAGTPSGAQVSFTSSDGAGNTSSPTALTFVSDTTAPGGGALSVNGTAASGSGTSSISSTTGISIGTRTDYKETQGSGQSGLASSILTVQSETYSNGSCGAPGSGGAYTSPATISGTTNPTTASGYCYLYTLTGTDNVGNASSLSTTVKVDATAPSAPSVALSSALGNTYVSGTTAYINAQGGKSGSFLATGSSTDGESGIATITLPSLSGFSSGGGTLGSPFETTYKWSGSVSASGAQGATATNGSGLTATNASAFTIVSDTTPPSGGSVSAPARENSTTIPVTFSAGTDSGSGISYSQGSLLRAEASYSVSSDSCGSFGSFSTNVGSPASSPASDTGAANNHCYEYEYRASDNVGNTATFGPSSPVKVDTTPPNASSLTAVNGSGQNHKVDAKDVITFNFSENIEPATITSAWSLASQPDQTVTVTFKDSGEGNGTNKPDSFAVTTAGIHLGSVEMSGGRWVPTKGGSYSYTATMHFSTVGASTRVTLTLVSLQSGGSSEGEEGEDTFTWTPDAAITDLAGNAIEASTHPTNRAEHF